MMPYSPDALNRIRRGASASDLGWDAQFYAGVCRKHGLPIIQRLPPQTQATPAIAATAVVTAPLLLKPPPVIEPPIAKGRCIYYTGTKTLRRGGHCVVLPDRRASLLIEIAKGAPTLPANGADIAALLGLTALRGIGGYILELRRCLAPLNVTIMSRLARQHSGYWFADLSTRAPLIVRFVNAAGPKT